MKGATHALLGVTTLLAQPWQALPADWPRFAVALGAAALGALLPDLDHDESAIRHQTGTARTDGALGRVVSALIPTHRGLTHSALALAAVWALALRFPRYWLIAAAIGYSSHLLADAITKHGIQIAWPLPGRLALTGLTTGGRGEQFIAACGAVGCMSLLLSRVGLSLDPLWQALRQIAEGLL